MTKPRRLGNYKTHNFPPVLESRKSSTNVPPSGEGPLSCTISGEADHGAPTDKNEQPHGVGTCHSSSFYASASAEGTLKPRLASILPFNFSVLPFCPMKMVAVAAPVFWGLF